MKLKVYCCICGYNYMVTDENDNDVDCPHCGNTNFVHLR